MNTKTMEGLVGAGTNMNLLETPFRVYKEAERRGDTGVMERAMGYMNKCSDKAEEYSKKADKGMKEDAEAARKTAEEAQEKAIRKRREEREKLEEFMKEGREAGRADTVQLSREGKALSDGNTADNTVSDNSEVIGTDSGKETANTGREAVIYTKTGEVSGTEQALNIFVSI